MLYSIAQLDASLPLLQYPPDDHVPSRWCNTQYSFPWLHCSHDQVMCLPQYSEPVSCLQQDLASCCWYQQVRVVRDQTYHSGQKRVAGVLCQSHWSEKVKSWPLCIRWNNYNYRTQYCGWYSWSYSASMTYHNTALPTLPIIAMRQSLTLLV